METAKSPLLRLIDKYFSGRTEKETQLLGLHTLLNTPTN